MKLYAIILATVFCLTVEAQVLPKNFNDLTKQVEPSLIEWRRHFHEFPELSNREFNTGKYIADFARTGHQFFNGKVLPVAVTTP